MTILRDAALDLLGHGWSVVPAQPAGKKPLIEWSEFARRHPSREEVMAWWKRWPNANIALITGSISGLVAVDVDVDRGGIPDPIHKEAPTEMISRTGSGGFHLFYTYPRGVDRVANRVGKDGVDIRGDGGYVIVPPSSHRSGRLYEWLHLGDPGAPPSWVIDAGEDGISTPPERWLTDLLSGVGQGSRNDSCTRLSGYFAGKGLAKDVAITLLGQWNTLNNPPLPEAEIKRTVDSIYRSAFRVHSDNGRNTDAVSKDSFRVVPFNQYMTQFGGDTVRWTIDEWIPQSTIAFIISPPGHYKTWMCLDLAQSIASGDPFLGQFTVNDTGPVIMVQQEDFHGELVERMGMIIAAKNRLVFDDPDSKEFLAPLPIDLPIFFHPDRFLRFDNEQAVKALERRVAEIKPRLVIVDPLYSAGKVDDYMAKTAEQMLPLKHMRDKYGCSFAIIHHTKKNTGGGDAREGVWGSQFLNAFMETGWQIRPGSDDLEITCRRHFKAKRDSKPMRIRFDISTEPPYRYNVECEEGEIDAGADVDIIKLIQEHGAMNPAEIADKSGVHRTTVSRRVRGLAKGGVLEKRPDGRYILPDLPNF